MERKKRSYLDLNYIQSLDKNDDFKKYRNLFKIPSKFIYFGANTLGLLPKNAVKLTKEFYFNC